MSQIIIDVERSIKTLVESITASIGEVVKLVQEQNRETRQCLLKMCLSKDSSQTLNEKLINTILGINEQFAKRITEKVSETINNSAESFQRNQTVPTVSKESSFNQELYNKRLRERKLWFWKYHRCNCIYAIFSEELKKENPRMPRKLQPVIINNEPAEELEVRKRLALEKFKHETELQFLRSKRFEYNFRKIDEEMKEYITNELSEAKAKQKLDKWEIDCKLEQTRSVTIFYKKKVWIESNLTNELRMKRPSKKSDESKYHTIELTQNHNKSRWPQNWKRKSKGRYHNKIRNDDTGHENEQNIMISKAKVSVRPLERN